ncbi:MAG: paraquat-inducible protein A [Verrucomicrobia bacterium]|nr:paraquat-inducible protein A [Verrucomicrobiota bacterium]
MSTEAPPGDFHPRTAAARGLASCHSCGKVQPVTQQRCGRCDAKLHLRKPDSLQRTWALTVAAAILYIPANVYPVMRADRLGGAEENTILSGVVLFWEHKAYPIAIVVFTASVLIPILKLLAIVTLCLAARRCRRPRAMTRIYRMTELVGRWSMVDVFVVAILVAVVQLGSLMSIQPGPAALAFAGVVITTMLAAMSFDPRLLWDAAQDAPQHHE